LQEQAKISYESETWQYQVIYQDKGCD